MKKEEVYVVLDTTEKVKQFYDVLVKAGEIISDLAFESWKNNQVRNSDLCGIIQNGEWMGGGHHNVSSKTEVSIDELASILGVYEFKVGDTVKVLSGGNGAFGADDRIGTIISKQEYIKSDRDLQAGWCGDLGSSKMLILIEDGGYKKYWALHPTDYKLELVKSKEQTKQPDQTVSREHVAEIYNIVCEGWQNEIESILSRNKFSNEIVVPQDIILSAYKEANPDQLAWLNKYLPKPKVEVTKTYTTWANIFKDGKSFKYHSRDEALKHASHQDLIATAVELTGTYKTFE